MLRPIIASTVLGAVVGSMLAAGVLLARADETPGAITIDNFSFAPATLTVKAGTTVTWTNRDDIPHGIGSANNAFKKGPALDTDNPNIVLAALFDDEARHFKRTPLPPPEISALGLNIHPGLLHLFSNL